MKHSTRLVKDETKHYFNFVLAFTLIVLIITNSFSKPSVNLKKEYAKTLLILSDELRSRQIINKSDVNFGAISCAQCNVLHTRAGEAMFPLIVTYKITGDDSYLTSALNLADWLINQQQDDGSWKETPEEWTGTTTDQLLMMVLSYDIISERLHENQHKRWKRSIEKAADYLASVMNNEFASINYCATTAASLSATFQIVPKEKYLLKSKELARTIIAKMDEDGFINGEGGKVHNSKLGVDLGYDLEMSLWGLGYYSKLTNDPIVNEAVKNSLKNHLFFIYPDGSMDNSWGIRSNKWTTYGSATSDGCQILFTMFAEIDPLYPTAAYKNLQAIRTCIHDSLLDYGPHYRDIFINDPCIYPTFAKAKNLAFAYELALDKDYTLSELPTEKINWLKEFKTLDLVQVRTKSFMSTITAYRYKDLSKGSKSKYMYRPTGGSISNLWINNHGFLQASSQTEYFRWEPMHFPEAEGVKCLTPRIEFEDTLGYFTNLFEFDGHIESQIIDTNVFEVHTIGELKDKDQYNCGVGYKLKHRFTDSILEKTVTVYYRDVHPIITIVEPIIDYSGMEYYLLDSSTVKIVSDDREIEFRLLSNNAKLIIGRNREKYWSPFPSLKAYPIELIINPDDKPSKVISYQIKVVK
jgi:hypothetical protein